MPVPDFSDEDDIDQLTPAARSSAPWVLGLSTAVCWFLIAGLSASVAAGQTGVWLLVRQAEAAPAPALLFVLPLLAFAAPALPLATLWGRARLATRAAVLTILLGLALAAVSASSIGWQASPLAIGVALAGASITAAAGSLFLVAMVGLANRRAVAGGLVGALVLRELARIAPVGEIGLRGRPGILLALGVIIAALGGWCLNRWRAAPGDDKGGSFERRAGGLRLRGALALGALLFFELTYGAGGRAALDEPLAAALAMVPPAFAWLFVVRPFDAPRHRLLAVLLAVAVTIGALVPLVTSRSALVLAALVLSHSAALMLLGRALAPVSGRRSGKNLTVGLTLFAGLSMGWMLTLVFYPQRFGEGGVGTIYAGAWVLVAGIVLTIAMHLTPRPPRAPGVLPDRWALAIAFAIPLLALIAATMGADNPISDLAWIAR